MKAPLDAVVFDMDGTLIDSSTAAPSAYIAAVQELGGPLLTRDEVIARYPLGPPPYILRDIFGRDVGEHELRTFHRHMAHYSSGVPIYDGIEELLEDLARRGTRTAVFTGASDESARLLLGGCNLDRHFEVVLGCDAYTPKPDPHGLLAAIDRLGLDAARVAYVGDGPLDQLAARSAGAVAVAAGWGHLFDPASPADFVAREPRDVLTLCDARCLA